MKYDYKIQKNDKFLCLYDYVMDDGRIAYTNGKVYFSEIDSCITDDDFDVDHKMEKQDDFFEYFKLLDVVS